MLDDRTSLAHLLPLLVDKGKISVTKLTVVMAIVLAKSNAFNLILFLKIKVSCCSGCIVLLGIMFCFVGSSELIALPSALE